MQSGLHVIVQIQIQNKNSKMPNNLCEKIILTSNPSELTSLEVSLNKFCL